MLHRLRMGRLGAMVAVLTVFLAAAMAPAATAATVSPGALSFTAEVGTISNSQTVTITNNGPGLDLPAPVLITIDGDDEFRFTNDCELSLAAGDDCTAEVTFFASAADTFTAQLNVQVGLEFFTVALDGLGTAAPPPPAPDARVSPSSLTFSTQAGTTSTAQQVTLENTGDAPLSINGIAIVGADSARFDRTADCGGTLDTGKSCTVTVTFKPVAEGPQAARLEFESDALSGTQSVTLSGTATAAPPPPAPGAQVSRGSLSFATQAGTTSGGRQVALKNTGNATLNIASIALVGRDAASFGFATGCGTSLAAGSSCTVTVTFSPSQAGDYDATLRFTDDAPTTTQDVDLNGSSNAVPGAEVSPDSHTFAAQVGNPIRPTRQVTLTNDGLAPLRISSIKLTGTGAANFTIANNCPISPGATLAPGDSCTVDVAFAPSTAGDKQATLLFTDDAPSRTQRVTLEGTATVALPRPAPYAEVSPGRLVFSTLAGTSRSGKVTLKNSGNAPLTITDIALAGPDALEFSVSARTCGASLAPNVSCTVDVQFAPSQAGDYEAVLRFTNNAANGTQDVDLNGSANAVPGAELSPGTLTFAADVGTTSRPLQVTLTNDGLAPLIIATIELTGTGAVNFSLPARTCGATLAAGASCTVDVAFAPLTPGEKQATLLFTDDAPGRAQLVTLEGTATVAPSSGVASAVVTRPPVAGLKPAPFSSVTVTDTDRDGTPDGKDACPTAPGDLTNGCQRALGADVRGVWRVNQLFTQLRNLTVRALTGSRIDVRCSGAPRACPFKTRVIARTTRRITSLTAWFKQPRILPAGVVITVRVMRAGRLGTYERLLTRRGRLLPKVTERCINHQKRLIRCV